MSISYRVLGVANPVYDRATEVGGSFLEKYRLSSGSAEVRDRAEVIRSWHEAYGEKKCVGMLGGGGTKAISVTACLSPKGTCALYGKIGDDEMGTEVKAAIEANGIFSLHTKGTKGTPIANCFLSNNTRTMMVDVGAAAEISPEEIKPAMFQGVEFIYVEGYLAFFGRTLQASVTVAREAHVPHIALGLPTSNVIKLFEDKFKEAAAQANTIFGNGREIMELTGESTVQKALGCFDSSQTVFATVNSEGCWVREKGKSDLVHIPTKPVPKVANPVGAGDTFAGAALAALLKGLPPSEAARWGNRVAGEAIQQPSATLTPKQWADLRVELRA